MATDTTNIQSEASNASSVAHEGDVERVQLTQGATQVQVPQGETVVRVQVTPGETIQLPFPSDQMFARLDDGNGNLAIKVGDITVILQGYVAAVGEGEVNLIDANGSAIDVAAVVAATDPALDIQTAAGPAAGDQGPGVDNNGGVFSPFAPLPGLGGLNAVGGLQATQLQYGLIEREFEVFETFEEADTTPIVVSIRPGNPVNEDDFHGRQYDRDLIRRLTTPEDEEGGEQSGEELSFARFSQDEGGPKWILGKHKEGNDPFDTDDHEDGSQTDTWFGSPEDGKSAFEPVISDDGFGGVDRDREPLWTRATVEANFFADLPGKLVFDANGDGINDGAGDVPLIDQLEGMGLTSHGHELAYMLLPAIPESAPGANDGTGQMVVAYYTIMNRGCPTNVVVFTIGVDDDVVNGGETNLAGNAEFGITFTIYGVVDHPTKGSGVAGEDILNIEVPFFLQDSDSPPVPGTFPQPLVFQDIDDVPFLGEVVYKSFCGFDVPLAIVKANLTIGHDESKGTQSTGYESDLQPNKGTDQYTDDVGGKLGNYLIGKADDLLDGIGGGEASGEDVDIGYQQGILAQLSSEFLSNGNFHADALGVAKTYLSVSFGADGKAKGNDQAGSTKFKHDYDAGDGKDLSFYNYDSNGNLLWNEGDATDKRAFELFMKDTSEGGSNEVLDSSKTNWTISFVNPDGSVQILSVYAFQLDANTIIGMASPSGFNSGGGDNDLEEARTQSILVDAEGGIDGEGDGIPVFMLRLDPESGQLVFVQYHQINNPLGGNADHPDYNNSANDPIHLYDADGNTLVFFEATDFDGDTVTAALEVSVIDDAPKAKDDYAEVDEGCETVTGNLITGISYDGNNKNDIGKDTLSVDEGHKIVQLKHDGVTYTLELDGAGNPTGVVKVSNGPDTNLVDGKLTIDTELGGKLTVQMTEAGSEDLGWYEYKSPHSVEHGDPVFAGFAAKADGSNDTLGEWAGAFNGYNIEQAGAPGSGFDFNNLAIKTVNVPGSAGNDPIIYRGIGVKHGIDGAETDKNDGALRIGFPGGADQWSATVTVGALFDGFHFDSGKQEFLKWEIFDNGVKVGEGTVAGDRDGLVTFEIAEGIKFDRIELSAVDNGGGNNGNNSDFLLLNVTTTKCDDDKTEKFDYVLQDADGDTSKATLNIDVQDLGPNAGTGVVHGSQTVVKEAALNDGQDPGPDGGTNPGSSAETAQGQIAGFDLGPDSQGAAINIQLVDANDSDSNSNNGTVITQAGDLRSMGQPLYMVSDGGLPATITAYRQGDDVKIFSLKIEGDGSYEFKLFDQLDHPDQGANGSQVGSSDVIHLKFEYTIVDGDACAPGLRDSQNDVAKGFITIGVQDDGPIVSLTVKTEGTVDIDESAGNQRDDQSDASVPAKFLAGGLGPIIEWAKDGDAIVQVSSNLGADRPGAVVLSVEVAAPGTNSGLDFVDSGGATRDIVLFKEGDIVVGRVSGGPDAGKAVFAIGIDQNGRLEVAQYAPIKHGNTSSHDEFEDLINSALKVKVTATDYDGDVATDIKDIGDLVKFYDDGPRIDSSKSVTLDEDVIPGAGGNHPGGTGDVAPSLYVASGNLNIDFGTDGPGEIEISLNGAPPRLTGDGPFLTFTQVGDTLIGHTGNQADPALTVKVENDGTFTVTLLKPLDHPNGNAENDIDLQFKVKVIDNDGDSVTGNINVKIDDDSPVINVTKGSDTGVVLDTQDAETIGANSDTRSSTANFSGVFGWTKNGGADGEASSSLVYSLGLGVAEGQPSGLTIGGAPINLYINGTTVTGSTSGTEGGINDGNRIFTISVNPSTGVVT
ncbi:MAG: hypothetical protein JNL25_13170, partial [Rhodospirillaceae bacterium]|nr:hypothetical protein [Rhodospirillaceae bacterium]